MKKIFLKNSIFIIFVLFFVGIDNTNATFGLDQSVKQVKVKNRPEIYYLDHDRGFKKLYVNEKSFLAYGNKWSDVKIVPEAELLKWKDAEVVKTENNPAVYRVTDGVKFLIQSKNEFNEMGYSWKDVLIIKDEDLAQYQNEENKINESDPIQGISVALIDIEEGRIVQGSSDNHIGSIIFHPLSSANYLRSIKLKFTGLFQNEILSTVYLTDEQGNKITNEKRMNSDREVEFYFKQNQFFIDDARELAVVVDLNNCVDCLNNAMGFSIGQDGIVFEDESYPTGLPVASKKLSLVSNQGLLGGVAVSEKLVSGLNNNIKPGGSSGVIANFSISENTGMEDINISKIILENKGTLKNEYLRNLSIRNDGRLISANLEISNKEIIFNVNYFKIRKGQSKDLQIFGNIQNGDGESINLSLKDIKATGELYKTGIYHSSNNISEETIIDKNYLSVSKISLDKGYKLSKLSDSDVVGAFKISSKANDLEIDNIKMEILKSGNFVLPKIFHIYDKQTGENILDIKNDKENEINVDLDQILNKRKRDLLLLVVAENMPAMTKDQSLTLSVKEVAYQAEGNNKIEQFDVKGYAFSNFKAISQTTVFQSATTTQGTTGGSQSNKLFRPANGRITYGFRDPDYIYDFEHNGIDIQVAQGSNVRAANGGNVIVAYDGGLNNYSYVVIDHGNGMKTVYGHLSVVSVLVGDTVKRGEIIGKSGGLPGTSGAGPYSNGAHLHFEVMVNNQFVDPELYF